MKLLVQLNNNRTGIIAVEIVNDTFETPIADDEFIYEVSDDGLANKILNDYENVSVSVSGRILDITPNGDEENACARKINLSEWKKRVRPALMRAATTTHLFNA